MLHSLHDREKGKGPGRKARHDDRIRDAIQGNELEGVGNIIRTEGRGRRGKPAISGFMLTIYS